MKTGGYKQHWFKRWLIRYLIWPFWLLDASKKISWCKSFIGLQEQILDIGSGMGSVARCLKQRGHDITTVDVKATHVYRADAAILYDGKKLPFVDQQFDVALLLTVLHHCNEPDAILHEAARVAQRVIVIEDIYTNRWQRCLTQAMDSLLNWEFAGHPHNNRTDAEWRVCFAKQGFLLNFASKHRVGGVFYQSCYVLDSPFKNLITSR